VRVRARNSLQLRFDACELSASTASNRSISRKMCVERFFANAQLLRQIVHVNCETVTEKVDPAHGQFAADSDRVFGLRPRFATGLFVVLITRPETNPVY